MPKRTYQPKKPLVKNFQKFSVFPRMYQWLKIDQLSGKKADEALDFIFEFISTGIIDFFLEYLPLPVSKTFEKELKKIKSEKEIVQVFEKYSIFIPDSFYRLNRHLNLKYIELRRKILKTSNE